eukprot:Tbor_TRINITY_DN5801_c4_g2::TRINITY_DN5801_c4_g2_i1::g.6584::m.6584
MGNGSSTLSEEIIAKDKVRTEAHTVVPSKIVQKAPEIYKLVENSALDNGDNTDSSKKAVDNNQHEEFVKFRDELLSFSLGEAAFDYAERLYTAQPNNPQVMALLSETAVLYDKSKNKERRNHWVDRMDLLQRAIDISRKCIHDNPEYGPCYRTYVMAATRASEAVYYLRWMKGMGLAENYNAIMLRGEKAVELLSSDAETCNAIACLNARCAQFTYPPYSWYTWYCGVPSNKVLLDRAIVYSKRAVERDPKSLEYMCRLGGAYYHSNELDKARRCFSAVRDEMVPNDIADTKWQTISHTLLAAGFDKNKKWNLAFS